MTSESRSRQDTSHGAEPPASDWPKVALAAVFVTALVTAQVIAVKVIALPVPDALPYLAPEVLVPAGVLAYALTFVASDCYTEIYGRRNAVVMVNVGFLMNFVMLALVWLAITMPAAETGVPQADFASVLGLSTNVVVASLAAYVVSQNWDVFVFHGLGEYTEGRMLWLRNLGSTLTSQLLDTVIFVSLAFAVVPAALGVGEALPLAVVLQMIIGQYLVKLAIAVLDTPVVYAVVGWLKRGGYALEAT
ncbi:MAG: queuosine precursor transporter [Halobacteriales archaeon]